MLCFGGVALSRFAFALFGGFAFVWLMGLGEVIILRVFYWKIFYIELTVVRKPVLFLVWQMCVVGFVRVESGVREAYLRIAFRDQPCPSSRERK